MIKELKKSTGRIKEALKFEWERVKEESKKGDLKQTN